MPEDMPRENYAAPAVYAIGTLGRVVRYIIVGAAGLALTAGLGYEGVHLYVEHVCLASPSRATPGDAEAWADENLPWTGGEKGGTDPRLGFKARHALRGAYIAWEMGAGEAAVISRRAMHPELDRGGSMIGATTARVDRGYELADEYVDLASAQAVARGIVFPPELDVGRAPGPPTELPTTSSADPTALDLLTLKAGLLERMNTAHTLAHAKDVYERVLRAQPPASDDVHRAREVRLVHKIGDLALRIGDREEAHEWWAYGLERAGLQIPQAAAKPQANSGSGGSWWWSFSSAPAPASPAPAAGSPSPATITSPALRRAATSILISTSSAAAQSGELDRAAQLQTVARALLPTPAWTQGGSGLAGAVPTSSTASATLQAVWEASRVALLELHAASVAHARRDKTVDARAVAADAAEHAQAVLGQLTPTLPQPYVARGAATAQPAERILRDTLLTGAEAQFTLAALLERAALWAPKTDRVHELEHASEAYERAMSLAAAESGTTDAHHLGEADGVGRTDDWRRYYAGYVRTREKIMKIVTEDDKK
jgi:hypothetical protein